MSRPNMINCISKHIYNFIQRISFPKILTIYNCYQPMLIFLCFVSVLCYYSPRTRLPVHNKRTKENSCIKCLNLFMQNRYCFFFNKHVHLCVIITRSSNTSVAPTWIFDRYKITFHHNNGGGGGGVLPPQFTNHQD